MKTKAIALLCAVCCLIGMTSVTTALADASPVIRTYSISLDMYAGGFMEAGVSVTCDEQASTVGFTTFVIEELRNGSWVVVASKASNLKSDAYSNYDSLTYTGTPGVSYRARATVKVVYQGTTEWRYPQTASKAARA